MEANTINWTTIIVALVSIVPALLTFVYNYLSCNFLGAYCWRYSTHYRPGSPFTKNPMRLSICSPSFLEKSLSLSAGKRSTLRRFFSRRSTTSTHHFFRFLGSFVSLNSLISAPHKEKWPGCSDALTRRRAHRYRMRFPGHDVRYKI